VASERKSFVRATEGMHFPTDTEDLSEFDKEDDNDDADDCDRSPSVQTMKAAGKCKQGDQDNKRNNDPIRQ
jgi:hypothetical protein